MPDSPHLWEDSYEMDGLTEVFLRELQRRTLTDEDVIRLSLPDREITLSAELRDQAKESLSRGAMQLLGGDLSAFSQAVGRLAQQRRAARDATKLEELPEHVLARGERRAQSILKYAAARGWIERDETTTSWILTSQGLEFLTNGGFNMR